MLVMLAYDVPETKHQTLLRKEFEALAANVCNIASTSLRARTTRLTALCATCAA